MSAQTKDGPGWVELLIEILDGLPGLPGAACRSRPHLFDERGLDEDPALTLQDQFLRRLGPSSSSGTPKRSACAPPARPSRPAGPGSTACHRPNDHPV